MNELFGFSANPKTTREKKKRKEAQKERRRKLKGHKVTPIKQIANTASKLLLRTVRNDGMKISFFLLEHLEQFFH